MATKIVNLCSSFPKLARSHSPLDNIAVKMFSPDVARFVQSSRPPEARYQIPVDANYLHYNTQLKNFAQYGPNEKYLINKVLHSTVPILYIVGGIGVGKTCFSHFFIRDVMPNLYHGNTHDERCCPFPIYYDVLDHGTAIPIDGTADGIKDAFLTTFCERVEAELNSKDFFDIEKEVGQVWEEILAEFDSQFNKPPSLSYIINRLREEGAEKKHLDKDYPGTIEKRRLIRKGLREDIARRADYLALLLRYLNKTVFKGHPGCLVVIVDNIDRKSSVVQMQVKHALLPFVRTGKIRTVVTARQTTYHQQLSDDDISELVDVAAYCGPEPIEIVKARLSEFIHNHDEYAQFYNPTALPMLVKGVEHLKTHFLENELFKTLLSCLCGHSVRKTLMLAQHLIDNSVYDPYELGALNLTNVTIGDFLRAILVGTEKCFSYSLNGVIENIFQVQEEPTKSHLIKLRILRVLGTGGDKGVTVGRLVSILEGFHYPLSLICHAINELKHVRKRLIWSDTLREDFDGEKGLALYAKSRLRLTSIGMGYEKRLYRTLEYLQEMMLDVTVANEKDFGHGWDYGKLEHRFTLILRFIALLISQDETEVQHFVATSTPQEYERIFGARSFLSKELLEGVGTSVERILKSRQSHALRRGKEQMDLFIEDHLADYRQHLNSITALEEKLLESVREV